MTLSLTVLLLIVPILLLIEGFFSGAEIALLNADRLQLKKQARLGMHGARLALDLADHPERILATTMLMTSVCVVGNSVLVALFFLQRFPDHGELLTVLVSSPLVVIFGELIPKTLFQRQAGFFAPLTAVPISWTYHIFFPITRLLSLYTTRISRLIGPVEEMLTGRKRSTRDELRQLLSYSKRESEIRPAQRKMIKRIFDFKESEAKHALIPLVQVEAIEDTCTVREALERFEQHRHSRMPVYSERVDNIVGIIDTTDLLTTSDLEQPVRNFVSSAHYVAETQALDDLLLEMRNEDMEMVVVVDEHGGAVGVLTLEDIVEEVMGEIRDEYDSEVTLFKEIAPGNWLIQARMEVHSMNELLKLELPEGEYKTLSGFLLQQFGRIPAPSDELFFDTPRASLRLTIRKASERHIELVHVQVLELKDDNR